MHIHYVLDTNGTTVYKRNTQKLSYLKCPASGFATCLNWIKSLTDFGFGNGFIAFLPFDIRFKHYVCVI